MGYSPSKQALQYSRLPPQAAERPSSLRYVSESAPRKSRISSSDFRTAIRFSL